MKKVIGIILSIVLVFSLIVFPVNAASTPTLYFRAHCAGTGWENKFTYAPGMCGTTGQSRQIECVELHLANCSGYLSVNVHVQNRGWLSTYNGTDIAAGTTGQGLRMEAINIRLVGDVANQYSIQYRAHVQDIGWMSWVSDGQTAGTVGQSRRIEALEIRLVAKSSSVSAKLNSFLADSRFKAGTSWGGSQKPKLSSYSCSGCCAYVADLVKYVYGKDSPRSGVYFTAPSQIRAGDVLVFSPQHWAYVISRSGSTVRIAHGNWGGKVVVANYTLNGSSLLGKTFSYGYHFE